MPLATFYNLVVFRVEVDSFVSSTPSEQLRQPVGPNKPKDIFLLGFRDAYPLI
jgi:hypothetical protein